MKQGLFISFEGGEASGKTTQIQMLKDYVESLKNKDDFVFVKEPGGTILGEKIRNLLMHDESDPPVAKAELFLYCASRVHLVEKVILPALKSGKTVIADRFFDSTVAYQGMARNIFSSDEILKLTKMLIGDLKPDLTFYLKVSPEIAFKRKNPNIALDRIEKEGLKFHKKVSKGFDFMTKLDKDRFFIIDATKTIDEIHEIVIKKFKEINNTQ